MCLCCVPSTNVRQMHSFHTSFLLAAFYFVSFLYFPSSHALASDITERNFQCKHNRAKQTRMKKNLVWSAAERRTVEINKKKCRFSLFSINNRKKTIFRVSFLRSIMSRLFNRFFQACFHSHTAEVHNQVVNCLKWHN